ADRRAQLVRDRLGGRNGTRTAAPVSDCPRAGYLDPLGDRDPQIPGLSYQPRNRSHRRRRLRIGADAGPAGLDVRGRNPARDRDELAGVPQGRGAGRPLCGLRGFDGADVALHIELRSRGADLRLRGHAARFEEIAAYLARSCADRQLGLRQCRDHPDGGDAELRSAQQFSYYQFRRFPSLSHSSAVAIRFCRVSSRFASAIHSRYSRRWLGAKASSEAFAFGAFASAAANWGWMSGTDLGACLVLRGAGAFFDSSAASRISASSSLSGG